MDLTSSYTRDGLAGSYTLREIIRDVPLSQDEDGVQAYITCVDAWNGNLYIGTSAGEILHYFQVPPDPADPDGQPAYIFAARIEPDPVTSQLSPADAGVKQILLIPQAEKACVLCNGVMRFYSLPELTPGINGRDIKQDGCLWVGGVDRNVDEEEDVSVGGKAIMVCRRSQIRLIHVGEVASKIRYIELGGICAVDRRGDLACVADAEAYSLLDVVNQRKQELFPISSSLSSQTLEPDLKPPVTSRQASRSMSSATSPVRQSRGHDRNISLGGQPRSIDRLKLDSGSPWPARASSRTSPSPIPSPNREESPPKVDKPLPQAPLENPPVEEVKPARPLPPNIVSPTPNEFLLTTGTRFDEPGVGMFVNLEGDLVPRGTLEFSSYPESLVLEGSGLDPSAPSSNQGSTEGFVLAIVQHKIEGSLQKCVEIQRWDANPGEAELSKEWLALGPAEDVSDPKFGRGFGLRVATTPAPMSNHSVASSLRLRRLVVKNEPNDRESDQKRNEEEDRFAARFEQLQANVLLYAKDKVSWVTQCPIIVQLDRQLQRAMEQQSDGTLMIHVSAIQSVISSIRGQEPRDELEFITLTYIRQKAALLLFGNLVLQTAQGVVAYEHDKRRAEDALSAAEIDPRVVLTMIQPLDGEIAEGSEGIWLPQGIRDTVDVLRKAIDQSKVARDSRGAYGDNILNVIRQYLFSWRKKKGFGSVADEAHVFWTVDAALIHTLLLLDQHSPRGPATVGTVRAELNEVVDHGVECFDRAIELFEQFGRIYMLSRLYQSRKMTSKVLATWKRIIEGEKDSGGELIDGEQRVRKYLTQIRDASLVKEYGSWLAHRNPKLGVQVFADDGGKIKFDSSEAVAVLQERAPGAVKDYLEHLVFGKNQVQYVNELIAYYLDTVLHALDNSPEAREILTSSYETYRALQPPKPTYRQFVTDNVVDAEWWRSRLRLLQLIGGSHGAASKYDVHALRERLKTYKNELVPEMIILNGREGKHEEALQLLTHGLGDYDTAIRYCLLGGSSIFHPSSNVAPSQPLPTQEEQAVLFGYLLNEFFAVEDLSERLERTAELLERFGGWFDIAHVLEMIPDSWSVELVSGFLVHAFRRLVWEKNETVVVKALCSAQNLRQSFDFIEKCEGQRPTILAAPPPSSPEIE